MTGEKDKPYCRGCCSDTECCVFDKLQIVDGCGESEVEMPADGKTSCFVVVVDYYYGG